MQHGKTIGSSTRGYVAVVVDVVVVDESEVMPSVDTVSEVMPSVDTVETITVDVANVGSGEGVAVGAGMDEDDWPVRWAKGFRFRISHTCMQCQCLCSSATAISPTSCLLQQQSEQK